jgi:rubrerythrin
MRSKPMHLFETEDGDKWICINCGVEAEPMITEKGWEWIFDRNDQTLRCSLCGHSDYDFED